MTRDFDSRLRVLLRDHQDLKDHQELLVKQVCQGHLAQKERPEHLGNPERLENLANAD